MILLEDAKVLVMGMERSGRAAFAFLHAHGANLVIQNADLLGGIRDGKLAKVAAPEES